MATLNLGRIKPVFRGAYAGGTAYVVDDIVTDGGETFICILASTGNATSNATYWTKLAQKGTDGTDVGATLTTQGDILYRDGSGLQRLGAGTNGQVLTTGGTGANPSWGTVSSDFVKLASQNLDATGLASVEFQNVFSSANDALYGGYICHYYSQNNGGTSGVNVRYMSGTNTELSGSTAYARAGVEGYRQTNNGGNGNGGTNDGDGIDRMDWDNWGQCDGNNHTEGNYVVANFQGGMYRNDITRNCIVQMSLRDNSNPDYIQGGIKSFRYHENDNITGLKFYVGGGAMSNGCITLWGLKK